MSKINWGFLGGVAFVGSLLYVGVNAYRAGKCDGRREAFLEAIAIVKDELIDALEEEHTDKEEEI